MSFVRGLSKAAVGAGSGIALITALPVFGAVGAISAVGLVFGTIVGAAAGVIDEIIDSRVSPTEEEPRKSRSRKRSS